MAKSIEFIATCPPLPRRPANGHKGTFGRVLIVGGAAEFLGAPALSGTAALRCGSGLVQIATPASILPHCLSITPELIGLALDDRAESDDELLDAAAKADAVAVGPGLGRSRAACSRVMKLMGMAGKPLVVDADALNILASLDAWPVDVAADAVLTPHPGEMGRLAKFIGRDSVPDDDAGRIELAVAFSRHVNQIVVLKGAGTVVTDGWRVYVNRTGDSSLAKGGTGDVLTGMIASFIGQGMDRFEAAVAAVHLHGLAGQLAGKSLGRRSVLAGDVIGHIADALDATGK